MTKVKREDCYTCNGSGKVTLYPLTDAPIWEREKEAVVVKCDRCKE